MKLTYLLVHVFVFATTVESQRISEFADCPRLGEILCVKIFPTYMYNNTYQYGTCVTTAYMEAKGLMCRRPNHPQCVIHCMVERHGLRQGPVYDDCKCYGAPEANSNETILSEECQSPDGTSCNWYTECLEKRFPCSGDVNSYAVEYGYKFCNLYENRASYFSEEGIQWIDEVRRCLQVALVPYVRNYGPPISCAEIKDAAFESHAPCYLDSGVCQLSCRDWAQVFWTIKSLLKDQFTSTVKQMYAVLKNCNSVNTGCLQVVKEVAERGSILINIFRRNYVGAFIKIIKMTIKNTGQSKRSVDQCDDDCAAREVGRQIAEQSGWNASSIDYVAFGNEIDGVVEIELLLTDWELINGTSNSSQLLEETTTELIDDLGNRQVRVELDGLKLEQVSACSNLICNETYSTASIPEGPDTEMPVSRSERIGSGRIVTGTVCGFYCLTCLLRSLLFL